MNNIKNNTSVSVIVDSAPFEDVLSEIASFINSFDVLPEFVEAFYDNIGNIDLADVEFESTMRADNFVIIIKPGNKLLKILTALRAGDREFCLANF